MSAGGRTLFQDVSADIGSGEMVALMGPSGSGKSTLIGGIAGLLPLDAGELRHEDAAADFVTHWLFQSTPLLARRSALDNVAVVAELHGASREIARENARMLLTELGLASRAELPVFRLSGGEKQRVAVAQALVSNAALVLADEPTASLDPDSRAYVVAGLQAAAAGGAAIVVATHDRWVAEACSRIVELSSTPSG
jgi:ABC-type lipoprotein export system ATPase subunit